MTAARVTGKRDIPPNERRYIPHDLKYQEFARNWHVCCGRTHLLTNEGVGGHARSCFSEKIKHPPNQLKPQTVRMSCINEPYRALFITRENYSNVQKPSASCFTFSTDFVLYIFI